MPSTRLSGGSAYTATTLIAPGQAFGPNGSPVQTYLVSESAINAIATSTNTLTQAAARAGMTIGELRGHVTTTAIDLNTGQTTTSNNRNAVLIQITVQLPKKKRAQDAANAIAQVVSQTTTSPYVGQSIGIIQSELKGFRTRLNTEKALVAAADAAAAQKGLSLDEGLLVKGADDTAHANLNETQTEILTTQQDLYLADQVEKTKIIQPAIAAKTTARSRRNSVVIGALIGLILGAIVATYVGLRRPRPQAV